MDEAELVRLVRSGRHDAFTELVACHQTPTRRLCARMVGNVRDADDLAQDALVEAYLKIGQLRDDRRFGAWLRAIALNRCREWHRQRRMLRPLTDSEASCDDGPDHSDVRDGVGRLAPQIRHALVLHYWEGLSCQEIAVYTNAPLGTVLSRLHRGRRELRRILEEPDGDRAMANEEEFGQEVDAEIRTLFRLYPTDGGARERLSILLDRSPGRVVEMIARADDGPQRADLALIIGRIGGRAVEATLACWLGTDSRLRSNAQAVFQRIVSRDGSRSLSPQSGRLAPRGVYALVDALIAADARSAQKTVLLVDLLAHAGKDDSIALLLVNALLCYPDEALPQLLPRFWECRAPSIVYRHGDVLWALCRLGTRFGANLLAALRGPAGSRREVALTGAEALARTLNHRPGQMGRGWMDLDCAADCDVALDARLRRKWAVPLAADRDGTVLSALAEAIAPLTAEGEVPTRARALRALGMLAKSRYFGLVNEAARSNDTSIRSAAIRALADMSDTRAIPVLVEAAASRDGLERRAAEEALTSMGHAAGRPIAAHRRLLATQPAPTTRFHMADVVRAGSAPQTFVSLVAALRTLPEDRPYRETEITRRIAQGCIDYSSVRRYMVEEGIVVRQSGLYTLTDAGRTAWRVEQFILARYGRGG